MKKLIISSLIGIMLLSGINSRVNAKEENKDCSNFGKENYLKYVSKSYEVYICKEKTGNNFYYLGRKRNTESRIFLDAVLISNHGDWDAYNNEYTYSIYSECGPNLPMGCDSYTPSKIVIGKDNTVISEEVVYAFKY